HLVEMIALALMSCPIFVRQIDELRCDLESLGQVTLGADLDRTRSTRAVSLFHIQRQRDAGLRAEWDADERHPVIGLPHHQHRRLAQPGARRIAVRPEVDRSDATWDGDKTSTRV